MIRRAQLDRQLAASGLPPMHELTPGRRGRPASRWSSARSRARRWPGWRTSRSRSPTATHAVRVLVPRERVRGVIVYFHGGGWVTGALDQFDTLARLLADRTDCAVVLVDYRLAPEHPSPPRSRTPGRPAVGGGTLEQIAGGAVPLIVAGDSAGGNLAAVVAQRARDWSRDRAAGTRLPGDRLRPRPRLLPRSRRTS